jgi:hypothetical protein
MNRSLQNRATELEQNTSRIYAPHPNGSHNASLKLHLPQIWEINAASASCLRVSGAISGSFFQPPECHQILVSFRSRSKKNPMFLDTIAEQVCVYAAHSNLFSSNRRLEPFPIDAH